MTNFKPLISQQCSYVNWTLIEEHGTVRKNPAFKYPVSTNPVDISPSEMNPAWFESRQDWIPSYLNPAKTQFRQTRIPLKVNPAKTESRLKWTPSWLKYVKRQYVPSENESRKRLIPTKTIRFLMTLMTSFKPWYLRCKKSRPSVKPLWLRWPQQP